MPEFVVSKSCWSTSGRKMLKSFTSSSPLSAKRWIAVRFAWRLFGRCGGHRHARLQTRRFSSSWRLLLFVLEIVRGKAKIGENFFVGNALPAAFLEPGFRLG